MKKVSVIIAAYNCELYVEEAIRSILDQTYTNLEVLIADDGSTDSTKDIIDSLEDNRIIRYHNEKNIGLLRTWNRLIPLTTGVYITWQDADDLSFPKRIEKLVGALDNDPVLMLCGSNFCRPFPNWKAISISNFPTDPARIMNLIDHRIEVPFPGTRAMIRRKVLEEVGPFREFYHKNGWEDFDFFCRVAEKYKVGNISDVLYEYRYFPQSASKIKLNQITSQKLFIQQIGFFLADQRKYNKGLDGLMAGGDEAGFQDFLMQMEIKLLEDPSKPIRNIVLNKCSNKDFGAALCLIPKAIATKPDKYENWELVYFWARNFIRSIGGYLLQSITGNYRREFKRYYNHL